jgi:putative addiction module component (TIGR02574 family)
MNMSQNLPDRALDLLNLPLTVDQRLDLITLLWDSIPDDALPVPEWHRQELERRLATADSNPAAAIPWEEVKHRLREKK